MSQQVSAASLVLDYSLYPRHQVNQHHVRDLMRALAGGAEFPPVIADKKSKRIVDGFHRVTATLRVHGDDANIAVEFRSYKNDAALLEESIRLNAAHGQRMTPYDIARCIVLGDELKITKERLAQALTWTVDELDKYRIRKIAYVDSKPVPIKLTAGHLAQSEISEDQIAGNTKAGGMRVMFYLNQIINAVEHDLIDTSDERVMAKLLELSSMLIEFQARVRKAA